MSSEASGVALSGISIVTVVLTVLDANDNTPQLLNPITSPISIVEVRSHLGLWIGETWGHNYFSV